MKDTPFIILILCITLCFVKAVTHTCSPSPEQVREVIKTLEPEDIFPKMSMEELSML